MADIEGELAYLRFLGGDESALDTLIGLYWESLTFFLGGYVRNLADAEELALDTFMEFAASAHNFTGRSSVKTFLFAIGRHLALMFVRKHKNDARRSLSPGEDASDDINSPESDFLKDERSRQLHAAMYKLKKEYREILYLIYFEDMSSQDAAAVLKKSRKQVENLSYRAKAALQLMLESEGFTYA
jgi:RNA polymerase sigma-70 factor (ECF subfamily)